jgi:hypothetical protein
MQIYFLHLQNVTKLCLTCTVKFTIKWLNVLKKIFINH